MPRVFLRFPSANVGTEIALYIVCRYSMYHFYHMTNMYLSIYDARHATSMYMCFATPHRFRIVECLEPCRCCLSAYLPHIIVDHDQITFHFCLEKTIGYYLAAILHIACFEIIVCSYMPNIAVDRVCTFDTTYFSIYSRISKFRIVFDTVTAAFSKNVIVSSPLVHTQYCWLFLW